MLLITNLKNLPDKPGVYLMKDEIGKVIYIGKAKSLKKRVRSYFRKDNSIKTRVLASHIHHIDYIVTDSEIDALILEANLIKLHLPRYNIRLKDSKKYPYIKITIGEDFPRAIPTRDLRDTKSIYFGPYTNAKNMRKALKAAMSIFPLRICKRLPKKACLQYELHKCYAPCEGKITKERYNEMVKGMVDFLSGKSSAVQKILEKSMQECAANMQFEEAAILRDRLIALKSAIRKQRVILKSKLDLDVAGLARSRNLASVAVIHIREGRMLGMENYILNIHKGDTDGEIMRAFLLQFYKNTFFIPGIVVVPAIREPDNLLRWLSQREKAVRLLIPKRGEKLALLELATENAVLHLEEEKRERIPRALLELQSRLFLERPPMRIEAFDISDISGKFAVGSCVVFTGIHPEKSMYRRYRVKTVQGIDDYRMMEEVVGRRLRRLKENNKLPDLILIDGGIGQVRSAVKVAQELGLSLPIFGLAKRFEEIYNKDGKVVSLPKDSSALRLLQRIRDEAHRFAVSYHRKLRDKLSSVLDEIPGIGEKRRNILMSHFGSVERMKNLTEDEIATAPGIGKKYASMVNSFLKEIYQ